MKDHEKTRERLIDELEKLRLRVAELEAPKQGKIWHEGSLELSFPKTPEKTRPGAMTGETCKGCRPLGNPGPAGFLIYSGKRIAAINPAFIDQTGYCREEVLAMSFWDFIHPEMRQMSIKYGLALQRGEAAFSQYQVKTLTKQGETKWLLVMATPVCYQGQDSVMVVGSDISERKRTEGALQEKEKELKIQAERLEEVNTALKVLLEHREEEKMRLEEDIMANLTKLIFPYLEKLENNGLNGESRIYLGIIKANLKDLVSPFTNTLSCRFSHLTPAEISVANLVKLGKTSKEIASLANVSIKAVSFHRGNIRRKLGLLNRKVNLRSYLQQLSSDGLRQ